MISPALRNASTLHFLSSRLSLSTDNLHYDPPLFTPTIPASPPPQPSITTGDLTALVQELHLQQQRAAEAEEAYSRLKDQRDEGRGGPPIPRRATPCSFTCGRATRPRLLPTEGGTQRSRGKGQRVGPRWSRDSPCTRRLLGPSPPAPPPRAPVPATRPSSGGSRPRLQSGASPMRHAPLPSPPPVSLP